MRILVRHAPPLRRWHRRLGERLTAAGQVVAFEAAGPSVGGWLLAVERRLYGIQADCNAIDLAAPAGGSERAADLTVALAGPIPTSGRIIRFDVAGHPGETELATAARGGVAPLVRVFGGPVDSPRLLATGRPAIEDARVAARAMEDLLPRLVTLLVQAVARLADEAAVPVPAADATRPPASAPAFLARGLAAKLARRFGGAKGRPDHWRVALRRPGDADWRPMADDPARFHADPFLFEEAGAVWLFTEEYTYAGGRGVIAAQALGEGAPASAEAPSIVLEEPFHLSYPLVLRHRGAIYMLPEAAQSGRLRLYRADRFPDRWTPDAVLLESRVGDATPVLHDGRWWLFATAFDDGGSSWDQLHLWHAPDLLGPWTPHAANPVLIDAGAARPAGAMWHENGVLMRPAQDCRAGYGAAIAICRVDRLDEGGFAQTIVSRIEPPAGARGLHTIDRGGGWEVCDLKVPHPPGRTPASTYRAEPASMVGCVDGAASPPRKMRNAGVSVSSHQG